MKNSSCIIQFVHYTSSSFYYAIKITDYLLRPINSGYTRINSAQLPLTLHTGCFQLNTNKVYKVKDISM